MVERDLSHQQRLQEDEYAFPYHYIDLYPKLANWTLTEESFRNTILELLGESQNRTVLDVGCGDGRLCYELARAGWRVTGIDFSEKAVAYGRAFSDNVTFIVGDITQYQPADSFDAMTLIEVLEHIPRESLPQAVVHLSRCLSDGGTLVVSVPSAIVPVSPKHYQHFTCDSLEAVLGTHFSVTAMHGHMRPGLRRSTYGFMLRAGRFLTPLSNRPVTSPYFALVRQLLHSVDRCPPQVGERIIAVCRKK